MNSLNNAIKATMVQAPLVAGVSDPDSSSVDMSGFESVLFVGNIGTTPGEGTVALQVEGSNSTGSTSFVALSGALATSTTGDDDTLIGVDCIKPVGYRYIRTALTRGTTETIEYGGTVAYQYNAATLPTSTTNFGAFTESISPTS